MKSRKREDEEEPEEEEDWEDDEDHDDHDDEDDDVDQDRVRSGLRLRRRGEQNACVPNGRSQLLQSCPGDSLRAPSRDRAARAARVALD